MQSRDYEEKRDFIRMLMDHPVTCVELASGQRFTGQAKDLSSKGLRLDIGRPLAEGAVLEVHIEPELSVVPPLHAVVEVVRVEPDETGERFMIGASIREFKS